MALFKEHNFKGFVAGYWKIININQNFRTGRTSVSVGLYKDEDARNNDVNDFIITEAFDIKKIDLTREEIYNQLKTFVNSNIGDPERNNVVFFEGSKDC